MQFFFSFFFSMLRWLKLIDSTCVKRKRLQMLAIDGPVRDSPYIYYPIGEEQFSKVFHMELRENYKAHQFHSHIQTLEFFNIIIDLYTRFRTSLPFY